MKFFKGSNVRVGMLIVLAGMITMPGRVLGQTNNPPYPGSDPSYNPGDGSTTEPIDTANGNNYFTESRLFVPCPGVPLTVDLKYQSITSHPEGRLGEGWVHSYEWSLDIQSSEAVLYTGSGEKKIF